MPKPFPGGGLLLRGQRRAGRKEQGVQDMLLLHRTWSAVIQFSARHLFCPIHARPPPTPPRAATGTAAGTAASMATRVRTRTRHRLPARLSTQGSVFSRRLSSAAAVASDPSPFSPSTCTATDAVLGHDRQRDACYRKDSIPVPRRSTFSVRSSPEVLQPRTQPGLDRILDPPTTSSALPSSPQPSPSTSSESSNSNHEKETSWRFPNTTSPDRHPQPQTPVQSWASTSLALSQFYGALHQIKSLPLSSRPPLSPDSSSLPSYQPSSALHSALVHYNYLSQLQSLHGTILVTRRDTRTLFLALSREPKSRSNLEQLLRIAMDMIWLNKKERQRKRRRMAPVSLSPTAATRVATALSAPSTPAVTEAGSEGFIYNGSTAEQYPVHHRHHSRADDYHGLRVSEYTILMNWIGTVTNHPSIEESYTRLNSGSGRLSTFNGAIASSSSTPGDQQMQQQQSREHQHSHRRHPITVEDPVERAWAIWQDFLLTGMKPDVVLYTALIDMLLKANKFSKADQIWNHMHHQTGNTSTTTVTGAASSGVMPIVDAAGGALVARALSRGAFASNTDTVADRESHDKMHQHHLRSLNQNRQRPSIYQFKNKNVSGGHGNVVGGDSHVALPNVQTLSVLMQNHVRYRDLEGVAETYKKLLQQPQQNQQRQPQHHHNQRRGVNNVLLNQVLTVLIDLRENKAAREIYAAMKASTSEHEEQLTNEGQVNGGRVSSYARPLHHMTHQRRSAWKQGTRDRPLTKSTASSADAAVAGTGSTNAQSSMIQPDETTHRLMLRLARQEQDAELEDQILDELYPFEKPPCL